VPIPRGQVITQPSLPAMMIAALALAGGQQVLEIGTSYGYQAALHALHSGGSGTFRSRWYGCDTPGSPQCRQIIEAGVMHL
jgi:predicted O-methyltransferase YrrM